MADLSPTAPCVAAAARQPAKSPARVINAEHLALALAARGQFRGIRWAALSNGARTSGCSQRQPGGGYLMHTPALLAPMDRGDIWRCVDRTQSYGRAEVLVTFGCGIRALRSEIVSSVMHTGAAS